MSLRQWTIDSAEQPERHFGLFLPEAPAPAGGWPLLCLLDGDWTWPLLQQALPPSQLECAVLYPYYGGPPEHIRLCRALDYTAPSPQGQTWPDPRVPDWQCGGAPAYLSLLQQQLDQVCRDTPDINPAQIHLFGHSYAGLFVLYALSHGLQNVQHYICASPSLWWHAPLAWQWLDSPARAQAHKPDFTLIAGANEKWYPHAQQGQTQRLGGKSTLPLMQELHSAMQDHSANNHLMILEQAGHGQVLEQATWQAYRLACHRAAIDDTKH